MSAQPSTTSPRCHRHGHRARDRGREHVRRDTPSPGEEGSPPNPGYWGGGDICGRRQSQADSDVRRGLENVLGR
jgi:hypothetical protein